MFLKQTQGHHEEAEETANNNGVICRSGTEDFARGEQGQRCVRLRISRGRY